MYCNQCGKQLPDDSVFCSACGAKVPSAVSAPTTEPAPAAETAPAPEAVNPPAPAPVYTPAPAPLPDTQPRQEFSPYCPPPAPPETPEHPMRWFKFIIYVQLFLSALAYLVNFLCYLSGAYYGDDAELVYEVFPGMEALDVGMALLCLGLAVFALVVRSRLAKFKRSAPMLLHIFLAVGIGITLAYVVAAIVITQQNLITASSASNIIACIVMLACNCIYFGKRKELFTN